MGVDSNAPPANRSIVQLFEEGWPSRKPSILLRKALGWPNSVRWACAVLAYLTMFLWPAIVASAGERFVWVLGAFIFSIGWLTVTIYNFAVRMAPAKKIIAAPAFALSALTFGALMLLMIASQPQNDARSFVWTICVLTEVSFGLVCLLLTFQLLRAALRSWIASIAQDGWVAPKTFYDA